MSKERERKIPGAGGDSKVVNKNKFRSGQTGQFIRKTQVGKPHSKLQNKK